ncbi:MAG: serine/threonine-protein phosphatase [Ardenticatenaceae bacterium]|nr:serine/threonine-protein phosphatase [Anaerolineales bacterium]MCB8938732.1 serine/threonine-protein phosphatase [Ardenticatenaceae bacterium]MCB8973968.1 serine/threonine-protein phosphatase [Ardenticatenaceae bacterium]
MEVQFAVAKIGKYATSESGDTLEMIERPHGGLSFVLVDGQRSGKSAKAISNLVARKAIQLLSEGVRDGAAARAAHDYLFTYRGGKVSATLNMLSVDMETKTFVISRNNESPVIVYTAEQGLYLLDEPSRCVGVYRNTKPVITELPILPGTVLVVFTDGLRHAGSLSGNGSYDPVAATQNMLGAGVTEARMLADTLLAEANAMDNGRPRDDISVLVVSVQTSNPKDDVRRMDVSLPI